MFCCRDGDETGGLEQGRQREEKAYYYYFLKNTGYKLGILAYTCNPSLGRQRWENCCEFEAIFDYYQVNSKPRYAEF